MKLRIKSEHEIKDQNSEILEWISFWLVELTIETSNKIFECLDINILTRQEYTDVLWQVKKLSKINNIRFLKWIITIRISDESCEAIHQWTKSSSEICLSVIQYWNYIEYLDNFKSISIWDATWIIIEYKEWKNYHLIKIPERLEKKLLEYLKKPYIDLNFDCSSFVHFLKWVNYVSPNFYHDLWEFTKFEQSLINSWDIIIIFENHDNKTWNVYWIKHFAVYLWEWMYLSKFWSIWNLIISSLDDMINLFWWNEIYIITPK